MPTASAVTPSTHTSSTSARAGLRVLHQTADAGARVEQQLAAGRGDPRERHGLQHAREQVGQRAGDQHVAPQADAGQAIRLRELHIARIDAAQPVEAGGGHRIERGERDDEHLREFAGAGPQAQQRNQPEQRHVAQRLERRLAELARERRTRHRRAECEPECDTEPEPERRAAQARAEIGREFAAAREFEQRGADLLQRHERILMGRVAGRRGLPRGQQQRRHDEAARAAAQRGERESTSHEGHSEAIPVGVSARAFASATRSAARVRSNGRARSRSAR